MHHKIILKRILWNHQEEQGDVTLPLPSLFIDMCSYDTTMVQLLPLTHDSCTCYLWIRDIRHMSVCDAVLCSNEASDIAIRYVSLLKIRMHCYFLLVRTVNWSICSECLLQVSTCQWWRKWRFSEWCWTIIWCLRVTSQPWQEHATTIPKPSITSGI